MSGRAESVIGSVERGGGSDRLLHGSDGPVGLPGQRTRRGLYGQYFIGECGMNLVHRRTLTPVGCTFRADRVEQGSEFLASTDNWFRPVSLANGPDEPLYICDMYRETIEHPWSIPSSLERHLDLRSGRDRGRIWRVTADAPPYRKLRWGPPAPGSRSRRCTAPPPGGGRRRRRSSSSGRTGPRSSPWNGSSRGRSDPPHAPRRSGHWRACRPCVRRWRSRAKSTRRRASASRRSAWRTSRRSSASATRTHASGWSWPTGWVRRATRGRPTSWRAWPTGRTCGSGPRSSVRRGTGPWSCCVD